MRCRDRNIEAENERMERWLTRSRRMYSPLCSFRGRISAADPSSVLVRRSDRLPGAPREQVKLQLLALAVQPSPENACSHCEQILLNPTGQIAFSASGIAAIERACSSRRQAPQERQERVEHLDGRSTSATIPTARTAINRCYSPTHYLL